MLLTTFNLNSDIAFSGQEAIEKVQDRVLNKNQECYRLIFMDINMPEMDGVQCT